MLLQKRFNCIYLTLFLSCTLFGEEFSFTPPLGWKRAEQKMLPKQVEIMLVGTSQYSFPPSINLAQETYHGTLQEYLKLVQAINDKEGSEWINLGMIETDAGEANLSQVEINTAWGDVRMMHLILVKDGKAIILTGSALKKEFSEFYEIFLGTFKTISYSH